MPDEKPPQPPQPKTTVELPAVPPWAIELTQSVKAGFARLDGIEDKVDQVANGLKLVTDEVEELKADVREFREFKGEITERMKNHSIRAVTTSEIDAQQSAELASERAAREALAAKVDALGTDVGTLKTDSSKNLAMMASLVDDVRKFAATPIVKLIAAAVGGAIASWLASKGIQVPR